MTQSRTVLVTGATGHQGGAVARALLRRGHAVRALTRSPDGAAARALARDGARPVAGDFSDADSLVAAARGADAVYAMGTPYGDSSPADEIRQGMVLIDAARAASVGHLIYSSVASADRATGVPHFDSKYRVEQHLAASGLAYTISAPVAFIDTFVAFGLKQDELQVPMPPARPLQVVSLRDIGEFAAALVERGAAVHGRRYEIAGDEITGEQMAAVLSQAFGRPVRYVGFPAAAVRAHSEDIALMFEWLDRVGYGVDRPALQRAFPELHWQRLDDWARGPDGQGVLTRLSQPAAAATA